MPTRVIDLGEVSPATAPAPKLLVTQARVGRYAALSYSWGDGVRHKVKLKKATLSSLQQEIPEAELTLSHREALQIARELGYRYIWIDAFGIIQDDKDDWAAQSVQIADVYGNADVTIVAGRSNNSLEGFLNHTYGPQLQPVAIPYSRPDTDVPEGSCCYIGLQRNKQVGPVDKRAWCFQESVLSRRMIVYGEQQLSFKCRHSTWQEDGSYELYKWGVQGRFDLSPEALADPSLSKGTILKRWYELTLLYSWRELYDPTDNFATLSGVAIRFQEALGCRYLAGLWEDDMVFALLWRSRRLIMGPHSEEALRKPIGVTKATKGMEIVRAPSWSWLALEGPIWCYSARDRQRKLQDPSTFRCRPADPNGVRWSPDDWDPRVVANLPLPCRLEVLSCIQKVRVSDTKPAEYLKKPKLGNMPGRCNANTVLLEHVDRHGAAEVSAAAAQEDIVAMGLFDMADGNPVILWVMCLSADEGLMLEKNSDGSFSRLGIFVVQDEAWFAEQREEKVVLI